MRLSGSRIAYTYPIERYEAIAQLQVVHEVGVYRAVVRVNERFAQPNVPRYVCDDRLTGNVENEVGVHHDRQASSFLHVSVSQHTRRETNGIYSVYIHTSYSRYGTHGKSKVWQSASRSQAKSSTVCRR